MRIGTLRQYLPSTSASLLSFSPCQRVVRAIQIRTIFSCISPSSSLLVSDDPPPCLLRSWKFDGYRVVLTYNSKAKLRKAEVITECNPSAINGAVVVHAPKILVPRVDRLTKGPRSQMFLFSHTACCFLPCRANGWNPELETSSPTNVFWNGALRVDKQ